MRMHRVVEAHDGIVVLDANGELHGHHRQPRPRHRIDMLDSRHARQHLLGRRRHQVLDIAHRRAGEGNQTSAMVTSICGSSSRGVTSVAKTPSKAPPAPAAASFANWRRSGRCGRKPPSRYLPCCRADLIWIAAFTGSRTTRSPACSPASTSTSPAATSFAEAQLAQAQHPLLVLHVDRSDLATSHDGCLRYRQLAGATDHEVRPRMHAGNEPRRFRPADRRVPRDMCRRVGGRQNTDGRCVDPSSEFRKLDPAPAVPSASAPAGTAGCCR
jgi:hypothetical protein